MSGKKTNRGGENETLLVELLTEELPPTLLKRLGQEFALKALDGLASLRLIDSVVDFTYFATPRRLAIRVPNVRERAPDTERDVQGPSVGAPAQAIAGFARKNGVAVEALKKQQTPKGEVYVARVTTAGRTLADSLAAKIEGALRSLPIPKLMRWGTGDTQFVRPVHGLVMLHGSRVIPGEVLRVKSSNRTLGHRFLSGSAIVLRHADDYERVLGEKGKVTVDFARRRTEIVQELEKAADGAKLVADDALLDEISALVEAPTIYSGEFDAGFLAVPEECLILSMQQHQKYVPLRDKGTGKLLPRFLFVSNLETKDPRQIVHGNERVLRARLADARFFYDQDCKVRLDARVPRLANVVYHNKLGSELERVERIKKLSGMIAGELKADITSAERAAWLSKADLLTDMVGEFPELQGIMGRHYALHDKEPKEVADAIETHYRPRFAGDALPEGPIGCSVALADKIISLAGLFGVQQEPTGDKDPFGLRRAALGLVRILVEKKLALNVDTLVASAFEVLPSQLVPAHIDVKEFVYERFTSYLKDRGYSSIEVDAVLSIKPPRLDLVPQRLEAVRTFLGLPEAESLAAANKRVANILKQAAIKGESFDKPDESALREPAEVALFKALAAASTRAKELFERGDYTGYLKAFAVLKTPVDTFFDSVMVMAEDRDLRQNRLALLARLRNEMNRVADISKLAA